MMNIYKIKPMNRIIDFAIKRLRNPNKIVKVQGSMMHLDKKDTFNLSVRKVWEPYMTKLFKKNIEVGNVVVDIGANIGYYTLIASQLSKKVYAFEPDTTNYEILLKNLELNNCKNVIPMNSAVLNNNGTMTLWLDKEDLGKHSLFIGNYTNKETITCDVIDVNDIEKADIMKIDAQGSEYRIVDRMEYCPKILFTELDPESLKNAGSSYQEYIELLKSKGFSIHIIDEINDKLVEVKEMPEKIYGAGVNLLCMKVKE